MLGRNAIPQFFILYLQAPWLAGVNWHIALFKNGKTELFTTHLDTHTMFLALDRAAHI